MGAWLTLAAFATGLAVWPWRREGLLPLHRDLGWALAGWGAAAALRPRALRRFLADIARFTRTDLGWLRRFPLALAGRRPFPYHAGVLDPGQRLMAWAILTAAAVGVVSGTLMQYTCAVACGTAFLVSLVAHRASVALLAAVLVAHVVVGVGLPRPYRGVWRAMHGRGRVPLDLARRLWPAWAEGAGQQGGGL